MEYWKNGVMEKCHKITFHFFLHVTNHSVTYSNNNLLEYWNAGSMEEYTKQLAIGKVCNN
jgi:hypothetical protein